MGREDAGGGLLLLTLAPAPEALGTYVRPGQYVTVRAADAKAHFVLAGDVGAADWQLVVRPGGAVVDAIVAAGLGTTFEISDALGRGFPCEEARGRPLLLAATGSGVAAIRAVVGQRLREGDASRTDVLVGVRTPADVSLASELAAWRSHGARVVVCLSRASSPAERGFANGRVQDVVRRELDHYEALRGGMIFAAGASGMVDAVRALSVDLGVAEADMRTNF